MDSGQNRFTLLCASEHILFSFYKLANRPTVTRDANESLAKYNEKVFSENFSLLVRTKRENQKTLNLNLIFVAFYWMMGNDGKANSMAFMAVLSIGLCATIHTVYYTAQTL